MNILLLSAAYPPKLGGVATHVSNLAHGLLKQKIEGWDKNFVYVITKSDEELDFYKRKKIINKNPALKRGRLQIWGIRVKDIYTGRGSPFNEILSFVLENWSSIKPEIIHVHDYESAFIGWLLKSTFNIPLIFSVHRAPTNWKDYKNEESAKDCFMEVMKLIIAFDRLVVPSLASKQVLLKQGFRKSKIIVIPHGIHYKWMHSLNKWQSSQEDIEPIEQIIKNKEIKLILCPVRADHHKDPMTFINSARIIKEKNPDKKFFFLLTGESNQYYDLEGTATRCGLEVGKDIIFKEFFFKEMPILYRRADICIIPSPRESFGQTAIEAFAFRCPVVAANSAALPEIIRHKENGLLFNPGDPEDLAFQVQTLLSDPGMVKNFVDNAYDVLCKKYSAEKMVDNYLKLYKKVIVERWKKKAALRGSALT